MAKRTMTHDEIDATLAAIDPASTPAVDASDLRAIADTADSISAYELELRRLVGIARANGKSWGMIAIALGVTRQSAHERYASPPAPTAASK